jgi:hypothetical protein
VVTSNQRQQGEVQVSHPTTPHPVAVRREAGGTALDINQTLTLGQVLARSGLFADSRDAAQAVVKVLAGQELGIGPIAAMTGINVIKGRVTLSANLMGAVIKRSGRYDYRVRKLTDTECQIDFIDKGEVIGTSTFTIEDARRAGLAGGDNWKRFPRNMLFARALSNGAKWYAPDVFGGSPPYTPDELDARVRLDPETGELLAPPAPVIDAEVIEPETTPTAGDQQAQVASLLAETGTDLSAFLAHYRAGEVKDLTAAQCAEAIRVLSIRPKLHSVSLPK